MIRAAVADIGASVREGKPADAMLARLLRAHPEYGSRDRRLISDSVFAGFRWRGWCEALVEDSGQRIALARALDGLPQHPALTCDPGLVDRARALPVDRLVPAWVREFIEPNYFERLVMSFQVRPPVWLRARIGHEDKVVAALARAGIEARRDPRSQQAIAFEKSTNLDLIRRECGTVFEVQDIASQLVGLLCRPLAGERWLDLCAGSGGKSLHLADLSGDEGEIVATDVRESALKELSRRARAAGAKSIRIAPPNESFERESFDGILIDAPCSGIGTWSRNPDARWRTESRDVLEKAALQLELLERSIAWLKPSGRLVFSVCTLSQPETAGVLSNFLSAHPRLLVRAVECAVPIAPIWPWEGPGDGMFAQVIAKR